MLIDTEFALIVIGEAGISLLLLLVIATLSNETEPGAVAVNAPPLVSTEPFVRLTLPRVEPTPACSMTFRGALFAVMPKFCRVISLLACKVKVTGLVFFVPIPNPVAGAVMFPT